MAKPRVETRTKDKGFKRIRQELEKLERDPYVKIGWPAENSKSTEQHDVARVTNVFLAVVHEFGTADGKVPERAPLRKNFDQNFRRWGALTKKLLGQIYEGKSTVEKALAILGEVILADFKKIVANGLQPGLAASTLARRLLKGDSDPTPLVDTSQWVNSATTKVISQGGKRTTRVTT